MAWIQTIEPEDANSELRRVYDRVKGPNGQIDNILKAHALRPHTLKGHMVLYKSVLHHQGNSLPKWMLETVGLQVSLLNECTYCVEHHYAGLQKLHSDQEFVRIVRETFEKSGQSRFADPKLQAMTDYVHILTVDPGSTKEETVKAMLDVGFSEGEVLEVNQVAAYFAYANRMVLGLGVDTQGEVLGLSPNDDNSEDNWNHK